VEIVPCPELLCDGLPTWHWNGDRCFAIECGACEGEDCGLGMVSEEACEAAHSECEATLCRATGGMWKFWAEQCGHDVCGRVPPEVCVVGYPACDCGPFANFVAGVGCMMDSTCPIPEPATPEELCTATGGEWGGFCCHTECGERCADDCVSPACHCPPGTVFDEGRGCIEHTRCFERELGQSCDPVRGRCPGAAGCCDSCGGAGCAGRPVCLAPVCDEDENTDLCGNNRLAP
jgi:hypothetical protein